MAKGGWPAGVDRVVLVDWIDSDMCADWTRTPELRGDVEATACRSVGWLVLENDAVVVLALSKAETDQVACYKRIPRVAVTAMADVLLPLPELEGASPPDPVNGAVRWLAASHLDQVAARLGGTAGDVAARSFASLPVGQDTVLFGLLHELVYGHPPPGWASRQGSSS